MQYKLEKRIHFELIPTSTSRNALDKLSDQRGHVSNQSHVSNQLEKQTLQVYLKLNYSF